MPVITSRKRGRAGGRVGAKEEAEEEEEEEDFKTLTDFLCPIQHVGAGTLARGSSRVHPFGGSGLPRKTGTSSPVLLRLSGS